jgi:hypothetical protein
MASLANDRHNSVSTLLKQALTYKERRIEKNMPSRGTWQSSYYPIPRYDVCPLFANAPQWKGHKFRRFCQKHLRMLSKITILSEILQEGAHKQVFLHLAMPNAPKLDHNVDRLVPFAIKKRKGIASPIFTSRNTNENQSAAWKIVHCC